MTIPYVIYSDGTNENEVPQELKEFAEIMAIRQTENYKDGPYYFSTEIQKGKKYFKLIRKEVWKDNQQMTGGSVVAFIDPDGNIYKSATAKAPAKGIRGNIYENKGRDAIGRDGYIRYFR